MSDSTGNTENIREKLRVTGDEEVLLTRRPSMFAFMPIYLVSVFILLIHLFFGWAETPNDAEWYEWVFFALVEASGWAGGAGFAFVMLFFTWLNRMVNHPASGKWVTTYLLVVSLTPLLLNLDDLIHVLFATENEFIPFDFSFTFFGIFWSGLMLALTFWYQKSFFYAVTTERIIHTQNFIYERDGHRILHEDIIAVHKKRSPIGALFGYATIYCNIGDQSHLATETTGISVGMPPAGDSSAKGPVGFLRKLFIIFTYQRTVKTERYTPDIAFYGVRKWEEAYDLINELHRENSSVSKADAQLEALESIQKLLSKDDGDEEAAPEAVKEEAAEESDDLLGDLDVDMDLD